MNIGCLSISKSFKISFNVIVFQCTSLALFLLSTFLSIPFDAIINGTVFLISFSDCSLQM